jgi:PAS domain S-box-containing protein
MLSIQQNKAECEIRAAYEQLAAAEEELKGQYAELGRQVTLLGESEEKYRGVFNAASDPLLLIDTKTAAILDLNTAACRVYGYSRDEMIRFTLRDLVPESGQGEEERLFDAPCHRKKDGSQFPVEVASSGQVLQGRNVTILSVRDVAPAKMIEDALRLTNVRLNLLLGITRHDILNKLTVLIGCNEILASRLTGPEVQDMLEMQKKATLGIKNHIDFTREYDNLGVRGPAWQCVEDIVLRSFAQFLKTVSFCCEVAELEIYADPMMEKVFYNLFDNAFRYGEGISEITVSWVRNGNGITLIFKDNGIGIPADEKERIFLRGYGRNTGLGLFLTREILSITGMEIRETGEYRKCAQFEIHVPEGHYRFMDRVGETRQCSHPAGAPAMNEYCEQEN